MILDMSVAATQDKLVVCVNNHEMFGSLCLLCMPLNCWHAITTRNQTILTSPSPHAELPLQSVCALDSCSHFLLVKQTYTCRGAGGWTLCAVCRALCMNVRAAYMNDKVLA